jgi:hypothetical protein
MAAMACPSSCDCLLLSLPQPAQEQPPRPQSSIHQLSHARLNPPWLPMLMPCRQDV